ncbi:MAG: hypothetical protein AAGD96_06385 [Chloroflexota bacterium]
MKTHYWLNYPADYTKQLKPLLHQQMWLFGQDILCPDGNLLYQYNFTHNPALEQGSSMYSCSNEGGQIVLWGWGVWFGRPELGAVFVNRYKALPCFTAVPTLSETIHRQAGLPHLTHRVTSETQAQAMCQLWIELLEWLAAYESWVLERYGVAWRQAALKPFPHVFTPVEDLDQLPNLWQSLAEQSQALTIKSFTS